ncbi:hypothetical protein, partial [Neisseria sicca]|uniref:hypothetical protein n=1 Tax=Neisseria sicca TaxID=490 RepID=UPI0016499DB0
VVLGVGEVMKNIGEMGEGKVGEIGVLVKVFGGELVVREIGEQRAGDKGGGVDLEGFGGGEIRLVGELEGEMGDVLMIIMVIGKEKKIGLGGVVGGWVKVADGGERVGEIGGVGN